MVGEDLTVGSFGATHGGKKRQSNEDAFLVDDVIGLYVVADGMGGHAAGEVASQEAVETIYGMVKQGLRAAPRLLGQLTPEHARTACRLIEGAVQAATYMVFALSEPHRNVITRAVGNRDYVEVDTGLVTIAEGDRFLLCSDGLHGYLREEEIAVLTFLGAEDAVGRLIELANDRGGKDNITAILVEVN